MPPDAQEQVKQAMLQLMQNSVQDWQQEPLFIRTKIGKLVAEVAKREYPQRWPEFLDIMLQVTTVVLLCGCSPNHPKPPSVRL